MTARTVLAIILLAMMVVAPAMAGTFNSNLQNRDSYTPYFTPYTPSGSAYWMESTTGGDNYAYATCNQNNNCGFYFPKTRSVPSAYIAFTATTNNVNHGVLITTFKSDGSTLASSAEVCNVGTSGRWEIIISEGTIYFYKDGLLKSSSAVSSNPYQVRAYVCGAPGVGELHLDDVVYGSDENKYVLGLPESNYGEFIILSDMINGANDGLYNTTSGTQANANYMTGQWARGGGTVPPEVLDNKTISLINYYTRVVYATNYTGALNYSTVSIDIKNLLIDANAPDGYYALAVLDEDAYSNLILKKSTGATVAFDEAGYSQQDTATLTWTVSNDYWIPGTYDYRLDVISATTGTVANSHPLSTQTGTDTYTWDSEDLPGAYYGVIIAKEKTTLKDHWMALDYADLDAYVTFIGYVMNETGSVLSGANVNITQGSIIENETSGFDGNYTATGFYAGAVTTINATASGYSQYLVSLIPLAAKQVQLNITINSTSPAYTGLAIGGIARDGVFDGTTITKGYGRPLNGVTVYVWNFTNSESYTKTTNIAGWYLCGEGEACFLTSSRIYDLQGRKGGYNNSQNYTVEI